MAMPTFTMRNLLEAGVHYGHHPRRWNPKMGNYLFGVRNGVHIINLEETVPNLYKAMEATRQTVAKGGRVLFVGTKRQASDIIAETAKRCGQYYVNHRWLGGMLTNWKTISHSIKRLRQFDEMLANKSEGFTKKELLQLTRERDKLDRAIGGIKDMGGVPDLLIVIDTNKEATAINEAVKLNVPVVAILDSNSDPDKITYPVPGNDDAIRAIQMYCDLFCGAILDGLQSELAAAGVDLGTQANLPKEDLSQIVESEKVAKPETKPAKTAKKDNSKTKPAAKKTVAKKNDADTDKEPSEATSS